MRLDRLQRQRRGSRQAAGLLAWLVVALALALLPTWAWAEGTSSPQRIDPDATCSITMQDVQAEGQEFTAWRVATIDRDGTLTAVEALSEGVAATGLDPAALTGSTDAETLRAYAETYAGLVVANPEGFDSVTATAKDGTAVLSDLKCGLYLVTSPTITVDGKTYVSSPYLVGVPSMSDQGVYEYDRTVKADKVTVTPAEQFKNRVQKLWSGDTASGRPTSVKVRIYDGTTLYQEVELSAKNDWSFEWEGKGDWKVVEDSSSLAGYTYSVATNQKDAKADNGSVAHQSTFQVTNTKPGDHHESHSGGTAKTGDYTSYLVPAALLAAGLVLVAVGVASRRRKDGED